MGQNNTYALFISGKTNIISSRITCAVSFVLAAAARQYVCKALFYTSIDSNQIESNRIELNGTKTREGMCVKLLYAARSLIFCDNVIIFQGKTQTNRNNMVSKTFHFVTRF